MISTARRSRPVASFTHSLKVEVHRASFVLLESAKHLDINKLARAARAEVELGYLETGCCQRFVRAVLRKGMVTKLVLEPCAERPRLKISPELARLLRAAGNRVRPKRRRAPRLPLPIAEFMSNAQAIFNETIFCIHLCFLWYCTWCCFYWEGDTEPGWGYLDCEGWIVGPFPPSRAARARSRPLRHGGRRNRIAQRPPEALSVERHGRKRRPPRSS